VLVGVGAAVVVVLGSLNADLVVSVRNHPGPGETVLGGELARHPGGKGANQAVAAHDAGALVRLLGRVGDDEVGAAYLRGLDERGVDTSRVLVTHDRPTGHALITVDAKGENTVVVSAGANGAVSPVDVTEWDDVIAGADVLLAQLELPLPTVVTAVRAARTHGVRVVLNAAPAADLPPDVFAAADPVVVNEGEAIALGSHPDSLCLTLGSRGARWIRHGRALQARAPEVAVVDTTGAGDAFAGTLAAALAAGADEAEALEAAVAAGSAAVSRAGAQDWRLG
jgi:ribokinase